MSSNTNNSDDRVPLGRSKKQFDLIERGVKKPSPLGTLTFVLLRGLDVPLQYAILHPAVGLGVNLLAKLGLQTIGSAPALLSSSAMPPSITGLGTGSILLTLSAVSTIRQVFWLTYLSAERFNPPAAISVSMYNTSVNSMNALLFLASATTSLRSRPVLHIPAWRPYMAAGGVELPLSTLVGVLFFAAGIAIETASEWQRKVFKAKPENKGKVCKTGLWRWARHINYLGYSMWRGGYCMVGSGWIGGLAMMFFQGYDLSQRAVAVLDEYCSARYKGQWVHFKKEVPYKIIPGVY